MLRPNSIVHLAGICYTALTLRKQNQEIRLLVHIFAAGLCIHQEKTGCLVPYHSNSPELFYYFLTQLRVLGPIA